MHYRQLTRLTVLAVASLHNLANHLTPPWDDIREKHTWNAVPPNWEALGHPPAGTTIDLHLALKPHHENALIDALYAVSNPRSPKYGAHLSKEQVAHLVAPHPDTLELISSWLEYHDVPSSSISMKHDGSWIMVSDVPVLQANKLLGASYQLYRQTGTNDSTILRTIGYGLPFVLHTHVQTIVPTTYFASPARSAADTTEALRRSNCGYGVERARVTPSDLRWLYRTFAYVPAATDRNVLGIAGYLNDYPSPTDLTAFMVECRTDAVDATYTVEQINGGGYDTSKPSSEANVNIQYAQAMAYPTKLTFYSTGGSGLYIVDSNKPAKGDMWLEWLEHVLDQPKVPQTISTPYGIDENVLPLEYAKTLCDMFARLGTRGASVIFSTGDDGVGKGDCKVNDGSGRVQFIPEFPATCPYVTSVGGTKGGTKDLGSEEGAELSGGGFSNLFPREWYQDVAVPTYLQKLGSEYEGLYNPAGRGIPDIAAQALNFYMIKGNEESAMVGTSCAVPTVAGIISLLNDYRLSRGETPLGFLNPWLYGEGLAGLNDITFGSNPGCGTEGFPASVGWDPVTGLGTPDFMTLQENLPVVLPTSTTATQQSQSQTTHTSQTNS
ncbi:subtilisin-like protein [Lactarius psammicola]|nr:subtilisin-like protein [Lactarius psammicola]